MHRITTTGNRIAPLAFRKSSLRGAHYYVDNTDALKSSHELAQKNPLLQKHWVTAPSNNSFQHPVIGRIICDTSGCRDKICDTPCEKPIMENAHIGHVTHSNYPGSKFLSGTDFNGQAKNQYGIFYEKPIPNNFADQNQSITKTQELNNNKDVQALIHIYSSRNPLDE